MNDVHRKETDIFIGLLGNACKMDKDPKCQTYISRYIEQIYMKSKKPAYTLLHKKFQINIYSDTILYNLLTYSQIYMHSVL